MIIILLRKHNRGALRINEISIKNSFETIALTIRESEILEKISEKVRKKIGGILQSVSNIDYSKIDELVAEMSQ